MRIVIIGTGNVATVFGKLLLQSGHRIIQVFGRNEARAGELAVALGAAPCSEWNAIDPSADLYLLAISDKALYETDRYMALSGQLVVHTAGSVPKEVLQKISSRYGVLYPLQSLRKELDVMTEIPLLVDANTEEALEAILDVATQISPNVNTKASDEQRLKLHLAATIVNNFTNHLYAESEKFCLKENIPFHLLVPLVAETARRLEVISPAEVQTGPAIRGDQVTINKHLVMLENHPSLKKLYELLTENIRAYG